jgi:hypothetical protein
MDDQEQQKQAERIVAYLNRMKLADFTVMAVKVGKRGEIMSYELELACKDGPGFVFISMQFPEVI